MVQEKLAAVVRAAPFLLEGAVMTIKISLIAIIIGSLLGTCVGIINCRRLRRPLIGPLLSFYTVVMRGTPVYVQILIVYFALPDLLGINLSPFMAGVCALGANSVAYVSEIVRAGINSIPQGQWEAAYALGYSTQATVRFIILPQMVRNVLPALTSELISLVKETSLLSSIGVLELTRASRNIIARELDPLTIYLAAAFLYLMMTTTLSLVAQKLEKGFSYD